MKSGIAMKGAVAVAMLAAALLAGCGGETPESMVGSAKQYLAKGDASAAVIQLKNALQKNPDLAEARFLLGKTLLESGDVAAAEKELRKAAELKYPADQVAPALARMLIRRGEYKKAVEEFGKAEVTSPEAKAELKTTLAEASLALGDKDAARAGFAAALAAVPGYAPAALGEARMKAGSGDLPGALAQVETALAKSPTLTDGWQLKGEIANAQGQTDVAMAAFRKALETRPDYLPAHMTLVSMLIQQRKLDEAGKQLEAMKKVAPKNPQTLYLQALLAFSEKNYTAARDAIQLQLKAAPDNLLGLMLEASIANQLGSYAQAETNLVKVLKRVPNQRFARAALVGTYLRTGQAAKALDTLKPLLADAGADSDVLALAGEVYVRNGDAAEAGRYFAKAAALDPNNARKRTALALSHVATGESALGFRELEDIAASDTGVRADIALIMGNVQQRKFDAALAAIATLEKKQPDKPLAYNLRGAVLVAKGDTAGARKNFERAAALDPADFGAAVSLAKLDLAEKKPAEAKKRFESVLAKDPKNVRALLAIADLRAREGGTPDEVAALIGKAITADPTSVGARLALISYRMGTKDPKKAVAAAQEALAAVPDNVELLFAAARAQEAAGETNQAVATYNKIAQLQPGSAAPFLAEAETQFAAKDYDGAMQSLRKALAIKPDLVEAQRAIITLQLKTGNTKEALAVAREVQQQRPKESSGYIFEGDIHASKKAWPEAIAAYRTGLKQTSAPETAIRLDAALRASGNNADADKFSAAWIKDHPKDIAYRNYTAQKAMAKKDLAAAAREYQQILADQPDNVIALNNLAWISGQMKDPKALQYAERAAKLAPNSAAVLDTLGVLLVEKGDSKRGVESLQQAVNLAPEAAGIRLNLARALAKTGQKDAAKKELDVLAKLGDKFPGQPEVAKLMKEL